MSGRQNKLSLKKPKKPRQVVEEDRPTDDDTNTSNSAPERLSVAGNLNNDSSSDSDTDTDVDLKKSIRHELSKKTVLEPFLGAVLNGILSSPRVFDSLVDAVYDSISDKVKAELVPVIKEEVYQSVSLDIQNTKEEVSTLQSEVSKLQAENANLIKQIDDQEQYSRRNCLLLHGVPEREGENPTKTCIHNVNTHLKLNITKEHLDRSHRVGQPKAGEDAKPRPIIMKFVSYAQRDEVFRAKRHLKGTKLLITESLTNRRMKILKAAQNLVRAGNIKRSWTQDGRIIVLTNADKKRKCEQYWPDSNERTTYKPMVVKHKQTQEYADFVIRDFILEKMGEKEPREVRQFHFISWPDMGVPKYPTPLINFLRLVNAYQPEEPGLPIIHCSAGVGRTGTFIVMDSMLEMADEEGTIDIIGAVRKLRKDRMNMVQTHEQYEFIYEAVQEAVLCGDSSIHVTNLRQGFSEIQNSVNKSTGNTKLKDQFQILDSLTAVPEQERSAGYAPENANKNRFPDRVPSDGVRPRLNSSDDESSVNYINAAFLDGYVRKREYIVTQMPLPNTVEDFWRMVYKYKSTSIVMLNGMENSDSNVGVYWVESGALPLVNLTVEFKSSKQYMDEVIGRTFKVYANDNPQDYLTVQQFQFLAWPVGRETPDSPAPLIAMIKIIDKWQQKQRKTGRARPMTVHCIDGVGVSGVFCALVSMLNRMKVEKVVDVFQSVKKLRMARPGMVETMEQYQFLFKAAQVSLEEFNIYENFR